MCAENGRIFLDDFLLLKSLDTVGNWQYTAKKASKKFLKLFFDPVIF